MADSNIVVSGLTAVGTSDQITLNWNAPYDPNFPGGLPYLQLDAVEIWGCDYNNRALSVLIGESRGTAFTDYLSDRRSEGRWYWVRARNRAGLYSEWNPVSDVDGVYATQGVLVSQGGIGYFTTPNGMSYQWGIAVSNFDGYAEDYFSRPFSEVFHVSHSAADDNGNPVFVNVTSYTTLGATFYVSEIGTSGLPEPLVGYSVRWMAFGIT